MQAVIYNPVEDYENKLQQQHWDNTNAFFDQLVQRSGVDIAQNRKTVEEYETYRDKVKKMRRKRNWLRFVRVLMILTILLIPLVIWWLTPKIRALKEQIATADAKAAQLLTQAHAQMQPLNSLFTDTDALRLAEKTMPLLRFSPCFSVEQEADMMINYDFTAGTDAEQSTIDVLAGYYNDNPFVFENRLIHTMGTETYHGYKTIYWTEHYRDSNGKLRTRTRSQTLHATVTKPKPFYNTQVVLSYCAQGGPELCFTRDATYLDQKSEKSIERYVKRGEKKLRRKTEKAINQNGTFMSMSNADFEVLFDALDRNNEVQFRTLFTPLAQTNMVKLLLSKTGYGDDFDFIKRNRTNHIVSKHSQGRPINLLPGHYYSYSYDVIRSNFVGQNCEFFKALYFDFAPLLAIPIYQERPVHSLKPIPSYEQLYSLKECEALANAVDARYVVHPDTKTQAILKSSFVQSKNGVDETCITAHSYDIAQQVDYVMVAGLDGKFHSVPVPWDQYLPLQASRNFYVSAADRVASPLAKRSNICIKEI